MPLLNHGVVNDTTLAESSSDELRPKKCPSLEPGLITNLEEDYEEIPTWSLVFNGSINKRRFFHIQMRIPHLDRAITSASQRGETRRARPV